MTVLRLLPCILALVLGLGAAGWAQADSFVSGADVVLVSGVAGDVESEAEYDSNLKALVQWLGTVTPPPASLTVFAEGNIPAAAPGLSVQKLEPTRASILEFAESKILGQRPVVWMLWGHGGAQGKTPVFHIRGPRLEPKDLVAIRDAIGNQASKWILGFRQSGAFAKPLINEKAEVLSSEGDVVFNSDPILIPQIALILREAPDLSFEELCKVAGEIVAKVYKEKGTARTEEPIFWQAGKDPVLVARNAALNETKTSPEGGVVETLVETAQTEVKPEPVKGPDVVNPEAWKDIQPVDPKKYPDAKAVVLSRTLKYVLGENPAIQAESDQFIQILTQEGQENGDITLTYEAPGESLSLLDCEIRRPDGKILRVDRSSISDVSLSQEPGYASSRRKMFSFPGVVPGAIIRLHYTRVWSRFPLPHLFVSADLGLPLPVLKTSVDIRVGGKTSFHYLLEGVEGEPEIETTPYAKIFRWNFKELPAQENEVLSPPETGVRLQASTFPDWESFAGWYERLIKLADVPTPEIEAKAKELTKDAKTDIEKVEAIYNYVAALRYVMIPLGVNSHRPHSAENTFKNQYGDCKDKANLFNTMLKTLGIEAYLVLVPRMSQADDNVPGLAFNHAISQVRLKDRNLWIDTTDPTCRFGMLPPGDPGRKVLVIDGKSRKLELLPESKPEDHKLKLVAEVDLTDPNGQASKLKVDPKGFPDYMLRLSGASQQKSAYPLLLDGYVPANGTFILERQKTGPIADLAKDTWWEASGRWSGILTAVANRTVIRPPVWLPNEWMFAANRRTGPLQLNKGYPIRLEETIRFKLPKGAKAELGENRSGGDGLFRFRCDWKQIPDGVELVFMAELAKGDLTREEAQKFGEALDQLRNALSTGAVF